MPVDLLEWLRDQCAEYDFDIVALYRARGDHAWPLTAQDENELELKLEDGAHFLPLPREPAALANILEVSVVDYLLGQVENAFDLHVARGTERGYPDIELKQRSRPEELCFAVDVKVARRARGAKRTQSRITLYTGNTYFRYPQLQWPGTFRPFNDYAAHLTLVCLYDLEPSHYARVSNLELLVQPTWTIASRQRSSTTRLRRHPARNHVDARRPPGQRALAVNRLALVTLLGGLVGALVWVSATSLGSGSVRTVQRQLAASRPPPSTNPYTASLRYARCMRRHGVPHPDPDKHGDFSLTPAQERRMRAVAAGKRKAADNACFYHLRALNLTPLSPHAIALAEKVVNDLGRCLRSRGHPVGNAQVRNLGRGRASFGFESLPGRDRAYWQSAAGKRELKTLERDHLICERHVRMAARLNTIIADDRRIRGDF